MAYTKTAVRAVMDDGRELTAMADQRDLAAAEGAEIDSRLTRMTWVRFIAWSALSRSKQYGGSWEEFNTKDCVEASDVAAEVPAGDEDRLDPGRPASAAGS